MAAKRRDGGQPLRDAMRAQRLTLQQVAERTRSDGHGVSWQLIAFLATSKRYGRETTSELSASLIEDALSVPRGSLFEYTS